MKTLNGACDGGSGWFWEAAGDVGEGGGVGGQCWVKWKRLDALNDAKRGGGSDR